MMIAEKVLGLPIDDRSVGAYTAVIEMGAIAAVLVYFWNDIVRLARAWFGGVTTPDRCTDADYRMGWFVIVGSIPVGVVSVAAQSLITGPLKSLWAVGAALVVERRAAVRREVRLPVAW
nr:undecaprenyl-diphosphate phosphatase [Aeromicrobium stalagmiti]